MIFISLGGVNEHGRNCFFFQGEKKSFLFDCGLSEKGEYPHFEKIDVSKVDYLFLSHSHLDHTGAIKELIKRGFKGIILASKETMDCINLKYEKSVCLTPLVKLVLDDDVSVLPRRSGHCFGSLSFELSAENKKIIYTGDYLENSIFRVDPIRDVNADFALVDACYSKELSYEENRIELFSLLSSIKGNIILPLPKNGRSMDVISLLNDKKIPFQIKGNGFFHENGKEYLKRNVLIKEDDDASLILMDDPQLDKKESRDIIDAYPSAHLIFTGTIDEGSYASFLMKNRKNTCFRRINVHQSVDEAKRLISLNHFKNSVLFHNKNLSEKTKVCF